MFSGNVRLCNSWNARYSGRRAFTYTKDTGYKCGHIFGRLYYAQRVIWALETGAWPIDQLDHINHDRIDNRMENLREVSNAENQRNRPMQSNNKSGYTGVSWDKATEKWKAQISVDGKKINLGGFFYIGDAIDARQMASVKAGYHINHGCM